MLGKCGRASALRITSLSSRTTLPNARQLTYRNASQLARAPTTARTKEFNSTLTLLGAASAVAGCVAIMLFQKPLHGDYEPDSANPLDHGTAGNLKYDAIPEMMLGMDLVNGVYASNMYTSLQTIRG